MTPHELIQELDNCQGPCTRFCAYCPENSMVAEIKECVENMYRTIYSLQADKDKLLEENLNLRKGAQI